MNSALWLYANAIYLIRCRLLDNLPEEALEIATHPLEHPLVRNYMVGPWGPRLCINCRHYSEDPPTASGDARVFRGRCGKKRTSLVNGREEEFDNSAHWERDAGVPLHCGPAAAFFEPKEP